MRFRISNQARDIMVLKQRVCEYLGWSEAILSVVILSEFDIHTSIPRLTPRRTISALNAHPKVTWQTFIMVCRVSRYVGCVVLLVI